MNTSSSRQESLQHTPEHVTALEPRKALARLGLVVAGSASLGLGLGLTIASAQDYYAAHDESPINNEMSDLASSLAGFEIRADCNDDSIEFAEFVTNRDIGGFVRGATADLPFGPKVMTLREDICEAISEESFTEYVTNIPEDTDIYANNLVWYAGNLKVMLHEMQHNNGVLNEAAAECYATQNLPLALQYLGVSATNATIAAQRVAESDYNSPEYSTPECKPGGEYDLGISPVYAIDRYSETS